MHIVVLYLYKPDHDHASGLHHDTTKPYFNNSLTGLFKNIFRGEDSTVSPNTSHPVKSTHRNRGTVLSCTSHPIKSTRPAIHTQNTPVPHAENSSFIQRLKDRIHSASNTLDETHRAKLATYNKNLDEFDQYIINRPNNGVNIFTKGVILLNKILRWVNKIASIYDIVLAIQIGEFVLNMAGFVYDLGWLYRAPWIITTLVMVNIFVGNRVTNTFIRTFFFACGGPIGGIAYFTMILIPRIMVAILDFFLRLCHVSVPKTADQKSSIFKGIGEIWAEAKRAYETDIRLYDRRSDYTAREAAKNHLDRLVSK